MGLKTLLAGRAVRVAHVLVIEASGSAQVRMRAEGALTRRGWRLAVSPAEADVLLMCGAAGPQLQAAVDRVWEQMPGPRARVSVQSAADIESSLDMAGAILRDDPAQRAQGRRRLGASEPDDHESMDHDDMNHGGMDMAPGGIALAEGTQDRDGLSLDALHVPLGPILAYWPATLVLHCTLHGDLIADADAEWLDADPAGPDIRDNDEGPPARWSAAQYCDATARLLAVAGWDAAAHAARRSRDALLGTAPSRRCAKDIGTLAKRVAGSRSMRWSLRGLMASGPGGAESELFTLPGLWLSAARAALEGSPLPPAAEGVSAEGLAARVVGLDIASARMVIAGCAPNLRSAGADHV